MRSDEVEDAFEHLLLKLNYVPPRCQKPGENGGDKLVHGSGGISQPRAE